MISSEHHEPFIHVPAELPNIFMLNSLEIFPIYTWNIMMTKVNTDIESYN